MYSVADNMNPQQYLGHYKILGNINKELSHELYRIILNKFAIVVTKDKYPSLREYQEKIFNLIEDLREMDINFIHEIFNYLMQSDNYLVDIVIMLWCLPRVGTCLSKKKYIKIYRQNIKKYISKLTALIQHPAIEIFCIETLSKNNYVPVHCIDLIWFYMNNISMEFIFYNSESSLYIGFMIPEDGDEYIKFGLNMERLLELDLGKVIYPNDPKGSLRNLLKKFVTDINLVERMLTISTGHNYRNQIKNISKNPQKYFGETLQELPREIIEIVNN
jgi:hypothetical protein